MNFNNFELNKQKTEEINIEKRLSFVDDIKDILDKSRNYLKSKGADLKVGAMVLLTMGSFEIVQGQEDGMSNFRDAIKDVDLGKNKIENVANSFYDSYKKKNLDSTYFVLEMQNSVIDGELTPESGVSTSGRSLNLMNLNDTVYLGDIEVKDFSVSAKKSVIVSDNDKQNISEEDIFKSVKGIKLNNNNVDNDNNDAKSYIEYGETPEVAVLMAISQIVSMKQCMVKSITHTEYRNENTSTPTSVSYLENNKYIDLSTVESHGILKDVKIVVTKMSDKQYRDAYKDIMLTHKETRNYNKNRLKNDKANYGVPKRDSSVDYFSYRAEIFYKGHRLLLNK